MIRSPIRWSSPVYMDPREGLALAIFVRLVATCREKADGTVEFVAYDDRTDRLPSTLTEGMIQHVARPFSFTRYHIHSLAGVRTDEDVLDMIGSMSEDVAEEWYAVHLAYIADVRSKLRKLAVGGHSLGFRCMD